MISPGSRISRRHDRDRYFKVIDAQFEAHRTRTETVRYLGEAFNMSHDRASGLYDDFVSHKRRKYRLFISVVLLSGVVSLAGFLVVTGQTDDGFSISPNRLSFALVPAVLLSPVTAWASLKHWRSTRRGAFEAVQTFVVYSLAIVALTLDLSLTIVLLAFGLNFA